MVHKTAIIIPVYNEHYSLEQLLFQINQLYPSISIIVVDDGSTPPILLDPKKNWGNTYLLRNKKNMGKGFSIRKGAQFADSVLHADYFITMDSDGQHAPEDLKQIFKFLRNQDFVIGWRNFSLQKMPFARILSNSISSFLLSKKLHYPIKDSQCGLRGFKRDLLEIVLECKENGFQFESEWIIRACKEKHYPVFVPIQTIYNSSKSHINKIRDIITFIKLFFTL